ncbi:MAG: hypothetical protein R3F19_09265 [Verrucomicrobiales bacterium]
MDQTDAILCVIDASEPWVPEPWEFVRGIPAELCRKLLFVVQRSDLTRSDAELQPILCIGDRWPTPVIEQPFVPFSAKLAQLAHGAGLDRED